MKNEVQRLFQKPVSGLPRLLRKWHLKAQLRAHQAYQPVLYGGKFIGAADRNCLDRWDMIRKEIQKHSGEKLLDIGCAEGFYVLQAAKTGCVAIGVDADPRRLSIAEDQLILENISGAGFILGLADEEMLARLPKSDIVLLLSVMHHMMYSFGVEHCRNYLRTLRPLVGKALIFEMGQSDETKNEWAKRLPDMGSDPHAWIGEFLLSAGFSKVEKIGESDSYKKDRRRAVFSVTL